MLGKSGSGFCLMAKSFFFQPVLLLLQAQCSLVPFPFDFMTVLCMLLFFFSPNFENNTYLGLKLQNWYGSRE